MTSKQLVLLGPPGVGVKTQAIALSERWHVPHVSASDLLADAETDAAAMTLMRRRFEQPDVMLKGWVLEGFPRSVSQAQALDGLLLSFGQPAANAVFIETMTGLLINRLMATGGAEASVSSIRQQLSQYKTETTPVLDYYQSNSRLTKVNGSRSVAEVTSDLLQWGEEPGATRFLQDEAELDSLLTQRPVVVVDCIASWCGPCKQVTPLIDRLAEEYGDRASVVKLDFDNNRQVSKRFGLKGMPSVMFFRGGELQETLTGVKSYEDYSETVARCLNGCLNM